MDSISEIDQGLLYNVSSRARIAMSAVMLANGAKRPEGKFKLPVTSKSKIEQVKTKRYTKRK
jgi:hypothetical protein